MVAEALFLRPYKKKENFAALYIASGLVLLLLGTVTGIPAAAGIPRFLWFFAAMAGCIAAVCFCYEEDIFTLTSACVAGFATQHIANMFTILLGLVFKVTLAWRALPVYACILFILSCAVFTSLVKNIKAKKLENVHGLEALDGD